METFLGIGLGNAAFATVLALAAAAIGTRYRRPALVHCLWLIVLLKLLTPPVWRVDAGALLPERPGEAGSPATLVPDIAEAAEVPASEMANDAFGEEPNVSTDPPPVGSVVPAPSVPRAGAQEHVVGRPSIGPLPEAGFSVLPSLPNRWLTWVVVLVWAGGSVVCAVVILVRVVCFGRLLRYADPAPETVQKLASVLADRIGLSSSDVPRVWFVPGSVCPMLWAVGGRPRVLVPRDLWGRLGARQRSALLAHELAHLRRGDHWVRLVELLVVVAYWWFPVAWWARRRLREAEEHCCDAWVVWALPAGSGRAYAGAILEAVEFVSDGPRVPALASGMGQFASLKWRLTMIRNEGVPRALSWYGRLAVAAVAGVLLPLAPSQSRAQSSGEAPAATPPATPAVQPAAVAPVTVTVPVPAAVDVAAERAVIAELALRSDDVRDDDDDDASDSKNKNQDKDKDKDKAKIKAYKELKEAKEGKDKEAKEKAAKAKAEADQREARKDEKGAEGDEDLAQARAEVRELSKQLEKAAQRLAKLEARRHAGRADGRGGAARMLPPAAPPTTPMPPMPPMPPQKPNFPQGFPGKPAPMPQGDFNRGRTPDMPGMERAREHRLEAIEQRLQALMREIEAIRRERDAQPRPAPQPQKQ